MIATMSAKKAIARKDEREKRRTSEILARLDQTYPDVNCALRHENPYQLLVATVLVAQAGAVVAVVLVAMVLRFRKRKSPSAAGREQVPSQNVVFHKKF